MVEVNDKESAEQEKQNGNGKKHGGKLEMIFTVLSLILILSMIGYLVKQTLATQTPAAFDLNVSDPIKRGNFTAVDVFVDNSGDQAAKAVNVSGEVIGPDGKPIDAEATLDWLPGRSRRKVTLIFPGDVTTTSPKIEVIGYEEP